MTDSSKKNPHPLDKQVGGDHYKSLAIQPVEYIRENDLGWYEGNIVKYITRHHQKGGRADVEKVIHYAEMLLAEYDDIELMKKLLARDPAPYLGELNEEEWNSIFSNSILWDVDAWETQDHQGVQNGIYLSGSPQSQSSPQLELPLEPQKPEPETPEYLRPVLSYEVRYGPYSTHFDYGPGNGIR